MPGTLYLVATPIGNLGDISARALQTLQEVDFVVCEDTRHSRILLDHYGISRETMSLPAFAEGQRAGRILDRLDGGQSCALITDAGSPAISDPGETLVAEALERGLQVVPVPGAVALVAALSASGLPTGRFHFLGFLPRGGPERQELLAEVAPLRASLVLYESPRRVADTFADLAQALGAERRACLARELTKRHEEFVRGTLGELAEQLAQREILGECVVVVEGRRGDVRWSEAEVRTALEGGLARGERLKSLANEVAKAAGWVGADVYRLGLGLKGR